MILHFCARAAAREWHEAAFVSQRAVTSSWHVFIPAMAALIIFTVAADLNSFHVVLRGDMKYKLPQGPSVLPLMMTFKCHCCSAPSALPTHGSSRGPNGSSLGFGGQERARRISPLTPLAGPKVSPPASERFLKALRGSDIFQMNIFLSDLSADLLGEQLLLLLENIYSLGTALADGKRGSEC